MRNIKEVTFTTESTAVQTKSCSTCGELSDITLFSKNRSKPDGHESSCKKCDSIRKARAYQKKQKELKKIKSVDQYSSSIEGELCEDAILSFSKIFEEIYRGLHYEGKI